MSLNQELALLVRSWPLLHPVSRVARFEVVQELLRVCSHIKGRETYLNPRTAGADPSPSCGIPPREFITLHTTIWLTSLLPTRASQHEKLS